MPFARRASTAGMISLTRKATCWTPAPWWSSQKRLIWLSRKNGRIGSFVANFTPLPGSAMTIDRRPEPAIRFAPADLGGVELDVPVMREAEDVAVPVHDGEHRVGVRRHVVDRREAVRVLLRLAVAHGLEPGSEVRVGPVALDEAERHVVERRRDVERPERPVRRFVRLDVRQERRPARVEERSRWPRRPSRGRRATRSRPGGSSGSAPRANPCGPGVETRTRIWPAPKTEASSPPRSTLSGAARATSVNPSASA